MNYSETIFEAGKAFGEKKAFLFDRDGLLFDTERLFMEQLAVVMWEYGYTLTREIYEETLGLNGEVLRKTMLGHFGEDYPYDAVNKKTAERTGIVAKTVGLQVKPGIRELLAWLKEQGIPCCVASSTKSETVRSYLKKSGLLTYFNEVIGGEMVEKGKPNPDIFLLACEKLNVSAKDSVVLEDSPNGIRAAFAAGCAVICVPDLKQPEGELMEMIDYLVKPFDTNLRR